MFVPLSRVFWIPLIEKMIKIIFPVFWKSCVGWSARMKREKEARVFVPLVDIVQSLNHKVRHLVCIIVKLRSLTILSKNPWPVTVLSLQYFPPGPGRPHWLPSTCSCGGSDIRNISQFLSSFPPSFPPSHSRELLFDLSEPTNCFSNEISLSFWVLSNSFLWRICSSREYKTTWWD